MRSTIYKALVICMLYPLTGWSQPATPSFKTNKLITLPPFLGFNLEVNYFKDSSDFRVTENTAGGFHYIYSPKEEIMLKPAGKNGIIRYEKTPIIYFYATQNSREITGPFMSEWVLGFSNFASSENKKHFIIPFLKNDSIYLQKQTGELLKVIDTSTAHSYYSFADRLRIYGIGAKKNHFNDGKWASLSNNGRVLYNVENNKKFYLYLDSLPIDSHNRSYVALKVNNKGDYLYAKGNKPTSPGEEYQFKMFRNGKLLGTARTILNYYLSPDGDYYFKGVRDGKAFILINNNSYEQMNYISEVNLPGNGNYLFECREDIDKKKISFIVNGKKYRYNFNKAVFPAMDKNGNFSFFGFRGNYLFPVVNGHKGDSLIRDGQNAKPYYISPGGKALYSFESMDSMLLFFDGKKILPSFHWKTPFHVRELNRFYQTFNQEHAPETGINLLNIQLGEKAYLFWKSRLIQMARPIPTGNVGEGEIIAGLVTDSDYLLIQRDKGKIHIYYNNQKILFEDQMDEIVRGSISFRDQEARFIYRKGKDVFSFRTGE